MSRKIMTASSLKALRSSTKKEKLLAVIDSHLKLYQKYIKRCRKHRDLENLLRNIKENGMYVYIRSEPGLFTVGFYKPDGSWEADSDHTVQEDAAKRVSYLNGNPEA